jgi:hypothetical protein
VQSGSGPTKGNYVTSWHEVTKEKTVHVSCSSFTRLFTLDNGNLMHSGLQSLTGTASLKSKVLRVEKAPVLCDKDLWASPF